MINLWERFFGREALSLPWLDLARLGSTWHRRGRRGIREGRACSLRTQVVGIEDLSAAEDGEADLERQPRLSYVDFIPHYSTQRRDTEPLLGQITFIPRIALRPCARALLPRRD